MTQKELKSGLRGLHNDGTSYFSIKHLKEGEDIIIDANRNGVVSFCEHLLESIDKDHLEKSDTYDFPDGFWDSSDVSISIRIQEGNKHTLERRGSFADQAGCFLAIAVGVLILIVGVVTSFRWLLEILN